MKKIALFILLCGIGNPPLSIASEQSASYWMSKELCSGDVFELVLSTKQSSIDSYIGNIGYKWIPRHSPLKIVKAEPNPCNRPNSVGQSCGGKFVLESPEGLTVRIEILLNATFDVYVSSAENHEWFGSGWCPNFPI